MIHNVKPVTTSFSGVRIPGSISETYIAAEKGHGYFEVGGSTLFYANLDDGRQLIASSGPFKQPVEAVVCFFCIIMCLRLGCRSGQHQCVNIVAMNREINYSLSQNFIQIFLR